jgi:rhamnosyltransferase
MPDCSILIRTFNEGKSIGRLLDGIGQQTVSDIETLLVDSGSTDETLEVARRFPVRIISIPPKAFTFGRALNLGLEHACSEKVVFASGHVYPVYNDWIEQLLAPFKDQRVALSYGKQRGNGKTTFSEKRIFVTWFPEGSDHDQKSPFSNNANAAIRRSVWERMPYNEELTGLEDLDWAKKVMEMGFKIAYSAEAEVIHVHEETPSMVYHRYMREALTLKRIYPEERFTFIDFFKLLSGNILSDMYHARRQGIFFKNSRSIIVFRLMQFWGTYRGYKKRGPVTNALRRRMYYPSLIELEAESLQCPQRKVVRMRETEARSK